MVQLASDPALTRTTVATDDLVICMSPITDSAGALTGYLPYNITAANFASQIVQMGLKALGSTLPGAAPAGGGLWLNAEAFSYSAVAGSESGTVLTVAAMLKSYAALAASLPTSDPGTGAGTYWSNNGVITESITPGNTDSSS
ncbi:hypothetical protein [Acetobacter aceti]|uniref:Uncharacterized protein n=1 Tax=Acetobacter aceti TaxID=435 RepID=A0A6S6PL29_ACEAC|nr:hypothetical protein [Acetobacter aceti]BCI68053.1 hypothetical protein AAJCM20276_26770 [Acetobacter aceti]